MLNLIHTEEFEKFKDFETKISVLHFQLEEASRNFEIFSNCLELKQITNYKIYSKIGEQYNLSRQRILDIYDKYLIHFILFLHYKLNYEWEHSMILQCMSVLDDSAKGRLYKFRLDKKPFKEANKRDLYFLSDRRYLNAKM